ncbi:hypothetical protein BS50DRAFT_656142 [Corynespora cassiicola Philippines]|uniref:Uncharacterized protein n=1 Tax=Corynespora cassiicola Philippines TaxID=1448308 RepID=A0A2T2N3L6_CORCC|nr:hypothetical protein BS50DRAFT_656142 [Corynespora cassiicola Philippines]
MDTEIILLPLGDEGSGFRTKNTTDCGYRRNIVDHGEKLITKATIVGIINGELSEGDPATLLIFEFRFISTKSSRRFIQAIITMKFEDANSDRTTQPEVYGISPSGSFFLNKSTAIGNIKQTANLGVNLGSTAGLGITAGYQWETEKSKEKVCSTKLSGQKRQLNEWSDADDTVIWGLEENDVTKGGIPNFLRAAVLLRRVDDVPFRFEVKVCTRVDFMSEIQQLVGLGKPRPIHPIEVDPKVDAKMLGVCYTLKEVDGTKYLSDLDLGKLAEVGVETEFETPTESLLART